MILEILYMFFVAFVTSFFSAIFSQLGVYSLIPKNGLFYPHNSFKKFCFYKVLEIFSMIWGFVIIILCGINYFYI